jgi:integrase
MADLSKVSQRDGLKPSREPHWHRLRPGCFVGYRPSAKGGAGTWIARAYEEERSRYRLKALGAFGEHPASARFTLAKEASEAFAIQVERGALAEARLETVADACREFAKSRPEAGQRFRRYVYDDPLAQVKLAKLRRSHVASWRDRVKDTPALVSRRKWGTPVTRPRSPATLNRDMSILRTALGSVLPLGAPNTEAAWQEALKPIRDAVKRRTLYLTLAQRRALVAAIVPEAQPFVRALCLLPLRPGAVAALTVADFDPRTSELTVGKDKAGAGRRIVVPAAAARHFAAAVKGKKPAASLFTRNNGSAWDKNSWKGPIADAARASKLPANVVAYTLRHSVVTDLVAAGLPLLTIAQISGTSAQMIEQHYGRLVRHAAVEALSTLSL